MRKYMEQDVVHVTFQQENTRQYKLQHNVQEFDVLVCFIVKHFSTHVLGLYYVSLLCGLCKVEGSVTSSVQFYMCRALRYLQGTLLLMQ